MAHGVMLVLFDRNIERGMYAGRWQSHIKLCQGKNIHNLTLHKDITLLILAFCKSAVRKKVKQRANNVMRIVQQQMPLKCTQCRV